MGEVLQFNRKEREEVKKAETVSEKLLELDNERKKMEFDRSNLISYGESIFEGTEEEKAKSYMGTMQYINRRILEIAKEMKELSKQL